MILNLNLTKKKEINMPQLQLPLLQTGTTEINDFLSVRKEGEFWYYFAGLNPVFSHEANDVESFSMFTSQLIASGQCRNIDIVKAFGVSASKVKRSVKKYKEGGIKSFFQPRKGRGGSVLTEEVKKECQRLLDNGLNRKEICKKLNIKYDALRKAISDGRLHEPKTDKTIVKKKLHRNQNEQ